MNRAICVCNFFICGANGIAKHSGGKILCRCPSQPFYQKVLDGQILILSTGPQKDNIIMFFPECSTLFKTSIISL